MLNIGGIRSPDVFRFFLDDVLEVNGSTPTKRCLDTQQIGTMAICEAVSSSVLFDGFIPTLNFSNNMWASELVALNGSTDLLVEWYSYTTLSSIEVVMFNCPEWGIGAQSIRLLVPKGHDIVASINATSTSCDSLVTVCIPVEPNIQYSIGLLQFSLSPNFQWTLLAEVRFRTNSDSQDNQLTTTPGK